MSILWPAATFILLLRVKHLPMEIELLASLLAGNLVPLLVAVKKICLDFGTDLPIAFFDAGN